MDSFKWTFRTSLCIYGQSQVSSKLFFFLRGEIRYTPCEMERGKEEREIQPCGKGKEIWVQARPSHINGTLRYNPYSKKEREYGARKTLMVHMAGHARPKWTRPRSSYDGQASTWRASRDPHPAGRDPHPLGHQPGHVKESGHWSRRPFAHKGSDQCIKDAW